jgi:hypothetical protein
VPALSPPGVDDVDFACRAACESIEPLPPSLYAIDRQVALGLVLGFASVGNDAIERAVIALARVLVS